MLKPEQFPDWVFTPGQFVPADDEHYASWAASAQRTRDKKYVALSAGDSAINVEQRVLEMVAEVERFDSLPPLERVRELLEKRCPAKGLSGYQKDAAIQAFYEHLTARAAIDLLPHSKICDKTPDGWFCTRGKGHEGPCAAHFGVYSETVGED